MTRSMFTLNMSRCSKPIALLLVLLFFAFSFNAYACLVPLNGGSSPGMQNGCSDQEEQPVRQICDSFKSLGIQAPPTSNLITHLTIDLTSVLVSTPLSFNGTSEHTYGQYPPPHRVPRETSSDTIALRI